MIESQFLRALISLPAIVYRLAVRMRLFLYRRKIFESDSLHAPVISVGNLTVGGSGKTPCVIFIANLLRDAGLKVAVLSRGYKRESTGRVEVSDDERILAGPAEAGDEPSLLARSCPGVRVIVDADRYAAGRWIEERAGIDVFILDDGFQHIRLARDLNLLLIDATEPLDRSRMVPLGRLREPIGEMRRADAIVITRSDRPFDKPALEETIAAHARPATPVFFARHEMAGFTLIGSDQAQPALDGPVAAISGIAKPDLFIADLAAQGLRIVLRQDFPDHHRYSSIEIQRFAEEALKAGAKAIVITEKDAANLPGQALTDLPLPIFAARIAFRCEDETALSTLLLESIKSVKCKV